MELLQFSLSSLTLSLSFALFLFFLLDLVLVLRRSSSSSSKAKLPPGPWKLPFIGSLHHILAAGSSMPHRALRSLSRRYGPLMHLQLGEISLVVVSSPTMAEQVLKTHDLAFADRPQQLIAAQVLTYGNKSISFAPYGAYWRQMRKICTMELLTPKRVRSFASIREDEAAELVRSIKSIAAAGGEGGGCMIPVNVTEKLYSLFVAVTARAAFGKRCQDQDVFVKSLHAAGTVAGGFHVCDVFPSLRILGPFRCRWKDRVETVHRKLDLVYDKIITDHQHKSIERGNNVGESDEEDLVDALLRHQKSGGLDYPITTNIMKAVIQDMFGAGTETSSTIIEWAMTELMRGPKAMEKAQAEVREALKGKKTIHQSDVQDLKYLKWVIKETLRLHPPIPLLVPRETREERCIDGYNIPIKTIVVVNNWAIGRDPKYWQDAESFRPERFDGSSVDYTGTQFHYLPFGAGKRICPGMSFAIANTEFVLATLLYHFNWQLPNGIGPDELDMTEAFGIAVGRKEDLHLLATPYDRHNIY